MMRRVAKLIARTENASLLPRLSLFIAIHGRPSEKSCNIRPHVKSLGRKVCLGDDASVSETEKYEVKTKIDFIPFLLRTYFTTIGEIFLHRRR